MPVEVLIYLCVGVMMGIGSLAFSWFCIDQIDLSDIGFAFLMIPLWPLGLVAVLIAVFSEMASSDWKITRKKKE